MPPGVHEAHAVLMLALCWPHVTQGAQEQHEARVLRTAACGILSESAICLPNPVWPWLLVQEGGKLVHASKKRL